MAADRSCRAAAGAARLPRQPAGEEPPSRLPSRRCPPRAPSTCPACSLRMWNAPRTRNRHTLCATTPVGRAAGAPRDGNRSSAGSRSDDLPVLLLMPPMMPMSLPMLQVVGQLVEHHVVLDAVDASAISCILRAHEPSRRVSSGARLGSGAGRSLASLRGGSSTCVHRCAVARVAGDACRCRRGAKGSP